MLRDKHPRRRQMAASLGCSMSVLYRFIEEARPFISNSRYILGHIYLARVEAAEDKRTAFEAIPDDNLC
jgi:hypothetical protein